MKLGDILAITNEHTIVNVVDCATGDNVACYDGKNSIDSALNDKEVVTQYVRVVPITSHVSIGQLFIEVLM